MSKQPYETPELLLRLIAPPAMIAASLESGDDNELEFSDLM